MIQKSDVAKLRKAIHKTNQRLVQIANSFGKDSATYKNAVAGFKSADLEQFVSKNDRIVASKVLKAMEEGKSDGQIERIINSAGYKISESGNLKQTKQGMQVATVTELKNEYIKDFGNPPEGVNIYDEINAIQETGEDLHDLVYEIQDKFGSPGKIDAIEEYFPELVGKNKRGIISYSEVEQAKRKARKILFEENPEEYREQARKRKEEARKREVEAISKFGNTKITNGDLKNE